MGRPDALAENDGEAAGGVADDQSAALDQHGQRARGDTSLSEQIAQQTDAYAFLFGEIGVGYQAKP